MNVRMEFILFIADFMRTNLKVRQIQSCVTGETAF